MKLTDDQKQTVNLLFTIVSIMESKRPYAKGHSKRVAELSRMLAKHLSLDQDEVDQIFIAALLHDIGYLALPDDVFNAKHSLSKRDRELLKSHSQVGVHVLSKAGFLDEVREIIGRHHDPGQAEDGPAVDEPEEPPLGSKIIRLAETFEAMIHPRPHRKKMTINEALYKIREEGAQFDSGLVRALVELLQEKAEGETSTVSPEAFERQLETALKSSLSDTPPGPVVPKTVGLIEKLLRDEKATVDQISQVIELEPSLALKIVKVANSSLYQGVNPARNVQESLIRVGLTEARDILITFMYQNLFRVVGKIYEPLIREWWEHALLTGVACQGLAHRAEVPNAHYAYLLGLLHDIGKPCLLRAFVEEWGVSPLKPYQFQALLDYIDRHHRRVGEKTVQGSGFPVIFISAIRHQGLAGPEALEPESLLINAANDIVEIIQSEPEIKTTSFQDVVSIALLGITPDDLERVVQLTTKRYNTISTFFS